jgi:SRSO17 transposase
VTHDENQAACAVSVDSAVLWEKFDQLVRLLAPLFTRRDLRSNAADYLRGLLMPGVAGNCWALAEALGHTRPDRLQHLLSGSVWDEDAVRDQVRTLLARELGTGGVLVFDETGQLKKGTRTAGVSRQYTGTAGRIENAIVAVYTTYVTERGHGLVDRDLYVPKAWCQAPGRMSGAGFEPGHVFATKPQLARAQAERAVQAGLDPGWAAGDEVYGRSTELRDYLEEHLIGYVFAVGIDHRVQVGGVTLRADKLPAIVPAAGWNRRSAGYGAKGPRLYDWAWIPADHDGHHLLIRRSIKHPSEIAFFLCHTPPGRTVTLATLTRIAGIRWRVEDDFQDAKGTVGLDQTQVRGYRAWKRHATLAMAALAVLELAAAAQRATHPPAVLPHHGDQAPPEDCGLVPVTRQETQRLLNYSTLIPGPAVPNRWAFHLRWTHWRRRHQARARWFHYRTRLAHSA